MPNWTADGEDTCGCTMGTSCSFHAQEQARRTAEYRAECAHNGEDPDASVEGLEGIVMAVELSPYLSDYQKQASRRIMFPARSR